MLTRLLVPIEISRPHNMIVAALGAVAGYYIAGGRDVQLGAAIALFTAIATGAGNVINDLFDVEIDRINKPRRPLPSRRMSRVYARVLYAVLVCFAAVGAFVWLPTAVAALVVAWQAALFLYAALLKRALVVGNLVVAIVSASAFLAGGLAAGNVRATVIPMAIAFYFVACREVIKGGEDVEGDAACGVQTIAVAAGVRGASRIAAAMMFSLALLIPIPSLVGYYGPEYVWIMEALVVPGLIIGAIAVVRRPDRRSFGAVSWVLKGTMLFGILAIVVGSR